MDGAPATIPPKSRNTLESGPNETFVLHSVEPFEVYRNAFHFRGGPPLVPRPEVTFFFVTLKPRVGWYTKSMSLKYEPASEPLHISEGEQVHTVVHLMCHTVVHLMCLDYSNTLCHQGHCAQQKVSSRMYVHHYLDPFAYGRGVSIHWCLAPTPP